MPDNSLLLLTGNLNKVREFGEMLGKDFRVKSAFAEYPELQPAIENGQSFQANALKKLRAADTIKTTCPLVAEDSGLCCQALDGKPGIYSARYGGEGLTDQSRRSLLSKNIAEVREAYFITVIALRLPPGCYLFFKGFCFGQLVLDERGNSGFGYDPLFQPWGYKRTFAEMTPQEKNRVSHRARAIAALAAFLKNR